MNQQVTAAIIAGGKGERIGGQDKGWLEVNGQPMIEWILQSIAPQVPHIIINANRNLKRYQQYQFPVITDPVNDFSGPLAGISAVMKAAQTDYILTLPCDTPKVSANLVERMWHTLIANHADIAIAHDGRRLQPMTALIATRLLPSLEAFLAAGDRKVALWYRQQKWTQVDFSDQPDLFFNANTEQQLKAMNTQPFRLGDSVKLPSP